MDRIRYIARVLYWTAYHRSFALGRWAAAHELGGLK